jgi:hypothetical protein
MSIRDITVPWALGAERANAKMLPAANDTTRPMAVDHVPLVDPAEPNPALDVLPDLQKVDMGELGCDADRVVMQSRITSDS